MPAIRTMVCEVCGGEFKARGFAKHQLACKRDSLQREQDQAALCSIQLPTVVHDDFPLPDVHHEVHNGRSQFEDYSDRGMSDERIASGSDVVLDCVQAPTVGLELDNIKIEYHPSSGNPPKVERFIDFQRYAAASRVTPPQKPWKPFRSRLDFEVAELALNASLSKDLTETLIHIVRCAASEQFTLSNYKDIKNTWEAASEQLTRFQRSVVSVPYREENREFEVFHKSIWDWACDLLRDPRIGPHITFDAQRLFKYNGEKFVRFVDEPWTANAFWDFQSQLPAGGKPLAFIIYADKAKLSTFGSQKGYPVIACLANLPTSIWNGESFAGGRVVGWLPVVEEDERHSGKRDWVNFKNIVWHASFVKHMETAAKHSEHGCWVKCFDDIARHFFPIILLLSADYEEQCVMALIRGYMGKCPCPVCLVPKGELLTATKVYPLRTRCHTEATLAEARDKSREEMETLLKTHGLRDVDSAFSIMHHRDVFRALSFDRLHANHEGNWADHLWAQFKHLVEVEGRSACVTVDEGFQQLPRWRNMNHFDHVMSTTFSDGSKHEDIGKLVVFATHNLLDSRSDVDESLYLLMRCIRAYMDVDMYAGFDVHTEETISDGRHATAEFLDLMKASSSKYNTQDDTKDWNYPKIHALTHLFDDIIAKGATRNYNMKTNEKCHGPLRRAYQRETNFKNVADQILRIDHHILIANSMRNNLDVLDSELAAEMKMYIGDSATEDSSNDLNMFHVTLGAVQCPQTLLKVEELHNNIPLFQRFRIKLNVFFSVYDIAQADGKKIKLMPTDTITEHHFLKVNFESKVNWCQSTDYLRCNPSFHNATRQDCVMIRSRESIMFGRLLMLFKCTVNGVDYLIALVHPFDAPVGLRLRKDKYLHFWHVRQRPAASSEFVFVQSIICGVLLVEDAGYPGTHIVIDTIDSDMFLRVKELFAARQRQLLR